MNTNLVTCLPLLLLLAAGQVFAVDTDQDTLPDSWELSHDRNPLIADYAINWGCQKDETGGSCNPATDLSPDSYPAVFTGGYCGSYYNEVKHVTYTPSLYNVEIALRTIRYTNYSNCAEVTFDQTTYNNVNADNLVQFFSGPYVFCFLDDMGKHCYDIYSNPSAMEEFKMDSDGDGMLRPDDPDDLDKLNPWIDTDSDGKHNQLDEDDDNDGVPDAVDAAPLDNANSNEINLPLDGSYKGLKNSVSAQ